jgi:hypothetical protein
MLAEAEKQKQGYLYVIDGRCLNPHSELEDIIEDIIGVFEVQNGQILRDSYQRNDNHVLI